MITPVSRLRLDRLHICAAALAAATAIVVWLVLAPAPAQASFGIAGFETAATNRDGTLDIQAGSHPYQLTTAIAFNTTTLNGEIVPEGGNLKNVQVELPPGFIGNANAMPKCTVHDLEVHTCSPETQIGVAHLKPRAGIQWLVPSTIPVYNLIPPHNLPAQFGFTLLEADVFVDSGVRTGGDYGVTSTINNASAMLPLDSSTLTLWGVPADPSHTSERQCLEFSQGFGCPSTALPVPLLTNPTSCMGPLTTTLRVNSWQEPDRLLSATSTGPALSGCEQLSFKPSIAVQPESSTADSPTGLAVDLKIPQQEESPEALATADLKKAAITLPAGVTVNPSAADGLQACSPAQIGIENASEPSCPNAAKIGSVEVDTPLLPDPLHGSVYLAQQGANPFGSLLAIYITVEADGSLIKLAGQIAADPSTGQLTTTFDNNPQLPFSELKLNLFGGPRAALATPQSCGTFTTMSDLMPWSAPFSGPAATPSNSFAIGSGCAGGFAPSFSAGTTNNAAGGFSPLSVTFSRSDADQELGGVSVQTPPGLLGILAGVERCPEPQAAQGTCGPNSLIGHATVAAGAGPNPVSVTGQVFLTGPYRGAPFGLSVAVPAVAGPFNLGTVVVRASVGVDPHTAQITVTSDSLPTILQGIPLKVKTVNVTVDRSSFIFNPTDCNPLAVTGTLSSTQGASANVSSPFQAANCAALSFRPGFAVSTQAQTSKKGGASLDVKLASSAGQANIGKVAVTLPKQLPSRLTTIQQACTEAAFAVNPASCPAGSNIGTAIARTPVLTNPLTGPAYLVSHGGAAFPDVVIVLQGEGVTLNLVGSVNIKKSITSSTFASVPDAPISSFELKLPEGPHSGLAAVVPAKAKGNLCGQSLVMPTTLTGQNGAQIKQNTRIAVTGCPKAKKKAKAKHKKKHTRGTHGKQTKTTKGKK